MTPIMLQQGYKALAVMFDIWGMANMVKDGIVEARAVIEKEVDAAKQDGTANGHPKNGTAEVVVAGKETWS